MTTISAVFERHWISCRCRSRLQPDITCTRVPWFPAEDSRAARIINDIVIGEDTDGADVSDHQLYLRAMRDVGASTLQFDAFCSLATTGIPVGIALTQIGVPPHGFRCVYDDGSGLSHD
jgi:hypothetical protein